MSLLDLLRSSFVEDSTPMSLLDLLRSSFVFLGLPKMFTISILNTSSGSGSFNSWL